MPQEIVAGEETPERVERRLGVERGDEPPERFLPRRWSEVVESRRAARRRDEVVGIEGDEVGGVPDARAQRNDPTGPVGTDQTQGRFHTQLPSCAARRHTQRSPSTARLVRIRGGLAGCRGPSPSSGSDAMMDPTTSDASVRSTVDAQGDVPQWLNGSSRRTRT